jgi:hypothetical protein
MKRAKDVQCAGLIRMLRRNTQNVVVQPSVGQVVVHVLRSWMRRQVIKRRAL